MKKQKKILISCLSSISVGIITLVLLLVFNVVGILTFLFSLIPLIALSIFAVIYYIKKSKKIKKESEKKVEPTGDYKVDLYGALGIPVQYNSDGSVKDIYELLQLEPIYNEKGDRVLTIYEFLGIMPKFTQDGKEIPVVVSIKNRVNRIAKVDLTQRVLTRKLTEAELEELLIKETLKRKLKEAEEEKDKAKQQLIIAAITKVESKKEKKDAAKQLIYKIQEKGNSIGDFYKNHVYVSNIKINKKTKSVNTEVKEDLSSKAGSEKTSKNIEKDEIYTFGIDTEMFI